MGACDGSSVAMDGLLVGRDVGSSVDGFNVGSSIVGCRVGSKVGNGVGGSRAGATVGSSLASARFTSEHQLGGSSDIIHMLSLIQPFNPLVREYIPGS